MINNTNEKNLIDKIEEYVNANGWSGFFGLLATISPHKIEQENLKNYNKGLEQTKVTEEQSQVEEISPSHIVEQSVQEASIYAPEHIPAVQDDLREQGLVSNQENNAINEPKMKVLEQQKVPAPNPWRDAEVVSPGQLNL